MKEDALTQGMEVDDSTLFFEAIGGLNRQGRSFGFGSKVKKYASTSSSKDKATQSSTSVHDRLGRLEDENACLAAEVAELRSLLQKNNTGTPNESHASTRLNDDDDMDEGYDAEGDDIIRF